MTRGLERKHTVSWIVPQNSKAEKSKDILLCKMQDIISLRRGGGPFQATCETEHLEPKVAVVDLVKN